MQQILEQALLLKIILFLRMKMQQIVEEHAQELMVRLLIL